MNAEELRDHLNKRHWNTVIIDGSLSDEIISEMVEDSYDLIVSKLARAQRQALSWHRSLEAGTTP